MNPAPDDTKTVLIAEDERRLADLFELWLESKYTVLKAYDGAEAIEHLSDDPDCMLLDRRMPGVSGDEVLEAARDRGIDSPAAMVTAVQPDFDVISMGFEKYIVKPVSKDDLLAVVEDLLEYESYDDLFQQYYRLASKRATLEATKTETELAESEAYQELLDELATVEARVDTSRSGLEDPFGDF